MRVAVLFASVLMIAVVGCGTQESAGGGEADTSMVYATVGDVNITENMINDELNMIPPYQRSSFESPEGKRLLLNHLIERELLLQDAEKLGLESDSFVVAQVELAMQQVQTTKERALIQTYYQQNVVDQVTVPEEDIQSYYEEHADDIYHQEAQVQVSHILLSSASDTALVKADLEAGESFEDIAAELSAHQPTSSNGGDLGWITMNAPMPYLGEQPQLVDTLFKTPVGEVIGPFTTAMGIHYFKVTDKREEGTKPLDEVRESIENTLKPTMVNDYFENTVIPGLRDAYGVTVNEDAFLPDESVSPDSLFQMAQNLMETNPQTAVEYFKLFIQRFPDNERANQAQFLVGFTLSEYMRDYDGAREAFQALIDNYPESDFVDDAQWMIENMGTPPESLFVEPDDSMDTTGADSTTQ